MKWHFFAQYNLFEEKVYMCYDYVHLDNLSNISTYRNHNVPEQTLFLSRNTFNYNYNKCKHDF